MRNCAGSPNRNRAPIVLCDLEGRTHDEAARLLGWPIGSVKGRQSRGREALRRRLARRGVSLPAAGLAAALTRDAAASVIPPALLDSTVKAAALFAVGGSVVAGVVPASAVGLAEGAIRTMFFTKLKIVAALAVAGGILATGAGVYAYQDRGDEEQAPPPSKGEAKPEEAGSGTVRRQDRGTEKDETTVSRKSNVEADPFGSRTPAAGASPPADVAEMGMGMEGMEGMEGMYAPTTRTGAEAKGYKPGGQDARSQLIVAKLAEPVNIPFATETPLEDVLDYLRQSTAGPDMATGIPIYVDPVGLQEIEATPLSPIVMTLDGVPLRTTLRLMLRQLGLSYTVLDGVLIISTPENLEELLTFGPIYDQRSLQVIGGQIRGGGMGGMGGFGDGGSGGGGFQ